MKKKHLRLENKEKLLEKRIKVAIKNKQEFAENKKTILMHPNPKER